MNSAKNKGPWQLYGLSAVLVLLAILNYFGTGGVYAEIRNSGIAHEDVWSFTLNPGGASLYLAQYFVAAFAFIALIALWSRSRVFPFAFLAYYFCYVGLSVVFIAVYPQPNMFVLGAGAAVTHSILCVPWLLYVFCSSRARGAFRKRIESE